MKKIEVSLKPVSYKKAMNLYWYLKWKGYVQGRIIKEAGFSIITYIVAMLCYFLNFKLGSIILLLIALVITFFFVKELIKVYGIRKEFELETHERIMISQKLGINKIITLVDQNGFREDTKIGEDVFHTWESFSKALLSEDIIFLIKDSWKFVYHFSKDEIGDKDFNNLVDYTSEKINLELTDVEFPMWYRTLLKWDN